MKALRAIATLLVLGAVGLVVAVALWAGLQVLLLVTWPWRRRAQLRASRAIVAHAITVATAQASAWGAVDQHLTSIPTQRSAR